VKHIENEERNNTNGEYEYEYGGPKIKGQLRENCCLNS